MGLLIFGIVGKPSFGKLFYRGMYSFSIPSTTLGYISILLQLIPIYEISYV